MRRRTTLLALGPGVLASLPAYSGVAVIGPLSAFGSVRLGSVDVPGGAAVLNGQIVSTGEARRALIALEKRGSVSVAPLLGVEATAGVGAGVALGHGNRGS